ncbi:hypothetical protein [Bacillus mycoides]|nr:hypothetical protein [Bacillus mycoides]QWH98211.1 hypothetical protein EXW36_29500 [Bacillus mycoides]
MGFGGSCSSCGGGFALLVGVTPAFRKKNTLRKKYNKPSIWTAHLHNYR